MLRLLFILLLILFNNSCTFIKKIKVEKVDTPLIQSPEIDNIKNIIKNNNSVIIRDNWGVPHIYGKTDADAAFGLAYANAQDDFFNIQQTVLKARGKYASVYGAGKNNINAIFDYMVGLLKIWENVDSKYYTDLSPETIKLCEAYAEGINYFIESNPDIMDQHIYPVNGKDVIAGTVHKIPFFFQLPFFLNDLSNKKPEDIPDHYTVGQTLDILDQIEGSNVYAISPKRTDDKSTLLAINSHQPWDGELAWYEAHVHSDEGLNMIGGLFPGSPVVLVGHNENLGWGHTVNKPDILDIYELEINPENENQYLFDGKWEDFETYDIDLNIRTFGKVSINSTQKAYWSVYGPVIKGKEAVYSIRYSKFDDIKIIEQWYKMNKASNFKEWKDAMSMMSIPMFNAGYADKEGNIFYVYNAGFPIRDESYDWQYVLKGNSSETLWTDYLEFENLPQLLNPESGFIQNCNSSPFQTTIGEDNPKIDDFSKTMGIEETMTNRALRALETFGKDDKITYDEFKEYKYDLKYSENSNMFYHVSKSIEILSNSDNFSEINKNTINTALKIFKEWDLFTDKDNIHASLPIIAFSRMLNENPKDISDEIIIEKISSAIEYLMSNYNQLNVRWGEVNRLMRGDTNIELSGGPDVPRAIYSKRMGNGQLKGIAGDCYILLVKWDKDGKVSSESIHQYGSNTQNSNSIHYSDQAILFAENKLKKTSIYLDEILLDFKNIQILK